MKYTLLDMTNVVMSSMDSEQVTSINDTPEAMQVAIVIRTCYYDLIARANLPEDYGFFKLVETSASTPTWMTMPTTHDTLQSVRYNIISPSNNVDQWRELEYMELNDFMDYIYRYGPTDPLVDTYTLTLNGVGTPVYYYNDRGPHFFTTIDDTNILFDSCDLTAGTYLKATYSQGYGKRLKTFTLSDGFTPELDDDQFPLLLQESKALAWAELKQTPHAKAEQQARRLRISQQMNKHGVKGSSDFNKLPNFGRPGRTGYTGFPWWY